MLAGSTADFVARDALDEGALDAIAGDAALSVVDIVEPSLLVVGRVAVAVRLVGSPEAGRGGPAMMI